MRIEAPWICGGCEHANAGYRRRCEACGQRRPPDADPPPASAASAAVAEGDVRPPLARWTLAVLAAGVAGAVFGVVNYVSVNRPSRADDRRALEAALLAPDEVGSGHIEAFREVSTDDRPVGILTGLVEECPELVEEELALLEEHGTAQIHQHLEASRVSILTYLAAFDTPVAAQNHRDLVESEEVRACVFGEDGADRVVGRWWIHVVVTQGPADGRREEALIDWIVDRLEIEG